MIATLLLLGILCGQIRVFADDTAYNASNQEGMTKYKASKSKVNGYYPKGTTFTFVWKNIEVDKLYHFYDTTAVTIGFAKKIMEPAITSSGILNTSKAHGHIIRTEHGSGYAAKATGASDVRATITKAVSDDGYAVLKVTYTGEIPDNANYIYLAEGEAGSNINNFVLRYQELPSDPTDSVDSTKPSVSVSVSGTTGTGINGTTYYKDNVAVTFSATDNQSGIDTLSVKKPGDSDYIDYKGKNSSSYSKSITFSNSEANKFYYYAKDAVGNKSSTDNHTYYIDTNNPTVSIDSPSSSWQTSNTLKISYSDGTSGITGYAVTTSKNTPESYTSVEATKSGSQFYQFTFNGTYYIHVRDAVGHTAYTTITISRVDTGKPSISGTVTGTYTNGWYKDSATLHLSASDEVSGIKSITVNGGAETGAARTITVGAGTSSYSYYSTDNAGNQSSTESTTIRVDNSSPTGLSLLPGTSSYTNKKVTLTVKAKDTYSGIQSIVLQKSADGLNWSNVTTLNGNGSLDYTGTIEISENGYYRITAYDMVNHSTTLSGLLSISNIDMDKPTITATITGTMINGWYKDNAVLNLKALDGCSGVQSITVNEETKTVDKINITAIPGSTTYTYNSTDQAGNNSDTGSTTINMDPSSPYDLSLIPSTADYTNKKVTFTIKSKDIFSGINKIVLQKSLDGSIWEDFKDIEVNNENDYTGQIDIEENGYYKFTAYDQVGHYSELTENDIVYIHNIDKQSPEITAEIEGEYISGCDWYKGSAVLKLTASDAGASGVKGIYCNQEETLADTKDISVDTEGENSYSYYTMDNAGNRSETGSNTLYVDSTAQTDLRMSPSTTDWTNEPIVFTVTGKDEFSGLASIELQWSDDKVTWETYKTKSYVGSTDLTTDTLQITDDGYFRIAVTDRVGYVTITDNADILYLDNYDSDNSSDTIIGITANTTDWVNKETGVELTSTGSDEKSGLAEIAVQEFNSKNDKLEDIKVQKYDGEKSIENTQYLIHENNIYSTRVLDQAGNITQIPKEEALSVENIDSISPEVSIEAESDPEQWITQEEGFVIESVLQDSESGLGDIKLQKLVLTYKEDGTTTEEWIDTDIAYEVVEIEETESSEEDSSDDTSNQEEDIQGDATEEDKQIEPTLSKSKHEVTITKIPGATIFATKIVLHFMYSAIADMTGDLTEIIEDTETMQRMIRTKARQQNHPTREKPGR